MLNRTNAALSMNREGRAGSPLPAALPGLPDGEPPKAGAQRSARPTTCPGSWSQCAVREPWRLSMNRTRPRSLARPQRERVAIGRVRDLAGGSWSQCVSKFWKTRLSMNREGRAGSPLPAALPGLPDGEPPKAGAQRSARPANNSCCGEVPPDLCDRLDLGHGGCLPDTRGDHRRMDVRRATRGDRGGPQRASLAPIVGHRLPT